MRLIISGYGGASGDSAGIYDTAEQRFIWKSGLPSISFLCSGKEEVESEAVDAGMGNHLLFGAGEHSGYGKLYMFVKDSPDYQGQYRLADSVTIPGGALCHIAYSSKHKLLTGACYENGDVFSISVEKNGFGQMCSYFRQDGDDPAMLSRAHCTVFGKDKDERFLYAANIAQDRVYVYEIINGVLYERGFASLSPGAGPRHILPFEDMLYVITEYSNEIIRLRLETPVRFAEAERISTLPKGFTGKSCCSTLCFWPLPEGLSKTAEPDLTGYIYAANRGANTIASFKRYKDGALVKCGDHFCGCDWPRHIALLNTPDATESPLLAVANEQAGRVSLCRIDPANGFVIEEVMRIPFEGASYVA